MQRPWYKKFWVLPAGIASLCAALLGILTVTGKAQDSLSKMVVENRAQYFHEDHKTLCDTMDSLKRAMILKDSSDKVIKDRIDLTLYILKEMATSDQKTRAMNNLNEDKVLGIVR
jgi:hypothetical protein